jgi:hypothetical protein
MAELSQESHEQLKESARLLEERCQEFPAESEQGVLLHMYQQICLEARQQDYAEGGEARKGFPVFHNY